jgi:hypothetical protein
MAFRIGRKHAQHTYPESRATTTVPLARNSASGPDESTDIDTTVQVPWNVIENGAVAGVNVPITPKTTGVIHVTGVITVASTDLTLVQLFVEVSGVDAPVPAAEAMTVAASAVVAIPFDVILGAGANGAPIATPLVIGATVPVQIRLAQTVGAGANIVALSSTISIQEVVPVTG